jgi:hypothetical protein
MKDPAKLIDDEETIEDSCVAMSHDRNNNNNNNNNNNKHKICLLIVVEIPVDRDVM